MNSSHAGEKELYDIKYSARYEGQKSSVCYSTDMWMMKNDEHTLNVCLMDVWFSEEKKTVCELETTQQDATLNCAKGKATMFDSFSSAYFIFMHEKQHRASCPVTAARPLSHADSHHREY